LPRAVDSAKFESMQQQFDTMQDLTGGAQVPAAEMTGAAPAARTPRSILLFWAPLAVQWLMMAIEGPFLAAIIARMSDPAHNLAAYGIAIAFAILLESPVIMLMSASTALAEDSESYRRLRNFSNALNLAATALVFVVLIPPIFNGITGDLLGVPAPVRSLVYGALWLLLPWPGAIGYRRFLHGILIRSGRTRLVAYGTLLRLAGMGATGMVLYHFFTLPGVWVGALSLSAGVVLEAIAARFMAAGAVARLKETPPEPAPERVQRQGRSAESYGDIARFYFPLALTTLVGLTVQPMLTFFMGRTAAPLESLAVFPVVYALAFLFRAPGLAFQEVVIALSGRRLEHIAPLRRFGTALGLAATAALALVTFTPLAGFWFGVVSSLPPDLAALAAEPARITVLLPALTVLMAFQQAVLVQTRRTRDITAASFFEVGGIALLFTLLGWQVGLFGASAAMAALVGGRLLSNGYLWTRVRRAL
jgi:Na+-driven multidrug efflux pump